MKKISTVIIYLGSILFFLGLGILVLTFYPVIVEEISYIFAPKNAVVATTGKPKSNELVPVDKNLGIVIPKIRANAKIIPNVDPFNSYEYQWALTKGVAMAKGSTMPGEDGNLFLFSHSSVNFYEALRYNSVFYLLTKLNKGDSVDIFYKGNKLEYKVTSTKLVSPTDISFLSQKSSKPTLTLMTCWPPGTTFKRYLVFATLYN